MADAFPLFELSRAVILSVGGTDIRSQVQGLSDAGLLNLPYPDVVIRFPLREMSLMLDNRECPGDIFVTVQCGGPLKLHTCTTHPPVDKSTDGRGSPVELFVAAPQNHSPIMILEKLTGESKILNLREHGPDFLQEWTGVIVFATTILVLSLATRNAVKTTSINKRVGTGRPSKSKFRSPSGIIYVSRTIVETPASDEMEDDADHPGTGKKKIPHMRRGHLHTVRHGIGRAESRQQWFPAVFVNADPDFVLAGRKYRVLQ